MLRRGINLGIGCLSLFVILGLSVNWSRAESSLLNKIEPDRISWSRLSYKTNSFFGKATTGVQLATLPAEEITDLLMAVPQGEVVQASGSTIMTITVHSDIKPLFGSNEILKTQAWCDPGDLKALQRDRQRLGNEKWQKRYRFTDKGVFRLRRKPKDSREENLSLDQWTKVRNHFYLYGDKDRGCLQILEPLSLLYIVSAIDLTSTKKPLNLCVFNKKQLFSVQMNIAGLIPIKVHYAEIVAGNEVLKRGEIDTIKISVKTRSLAEPNQEKEKFSFLGLNGDFDIYIEKTSRTPVQVSGRIATFGNVDIRLQTVNLKPKDS